MTAREALEQINGLTAFEAYVRERAEARSPAPEQAPELHEEEQTVFMGGALLDPDGATVRHPGEKKGQVTVVGAAARAIADKPHLTEGTDHYWPEWDELEREETDPSKPPLKIQW